MLTSAMGMSTGLCGNFYLSCDARATAIGDSAVTLRCVLPIACSFCISVESRQILRIEDPTKSFQIVSVEIDRPNE